MSENGQSNPTWWRRSLAAAAFASHVSTLLFFVSATPLSTWLYGAGHRDPLTFALGCLPFAAASVLLILFCTVVPTFCEPAEVRGPSILTFPAVFCGFAFLVSHNLASVRSPIALIGEQPRSDQLASRPEVLTIAFLVQSLTLAVSAKAGGGRAL